MQGSYVVSMTTSQGHKPVSKIKIWIMEARPQYLLLPAVLILIGTGAAWYYNAVNIGYSILALIGLLLTHISVNVLNDYFDFKSGVDLKTIKTPFSGGSGILPAGLLTPKQVLAYGITAFVLALPIGIFFVIVQGWQLIPILILGGICVIFYTPMILKIDFPEWSPGLGLGILPVLGAFFVQTGTYTAEILIASIPSGILVCNLLLLNEFPDAEADLIGNKRTLPIRAGKKKSAFVYSGLTILVYLWITGAVITGWMPIFCLLGLLTVPFAYKAIKGSFHYNEMNKIVPAMASNVVIVLATQFLIGAGFIISRIIGI
jgi:1,4-dihydroxy-2-naphthoate polyprenyltransferase